MEEQAKLLNQIMDIATEIEVDIHYEDFELYNKLCISHRISQISDIIFNLKQSINK